MPRTINPQTAYRFVAHTTHGHTYASVQRTVAGKDGRNVRRHLHYGVIEDGRFVPWAEFLALPREERSRFVFPDSWDLSLLDRLSDRRGAGRPPVVGEERNRLYGDIWLLERIAESTGIRRDLETVFGGNGEMVDAIMTLAMFPYLTRFSLSRVERWQRIARAPSDLPLTPKAITALTQAITERHRMELLSLRASRLGRDEMCAVDSTSRSAYGDSLADIHWGKNKERLPLAQLLSVVVYTLSGHEPVYYRTFPGNIPDSRSLDTIMRDLSDAGFRDIVLITDRGYDSLRNMERIIRAGQSAIMSVRVGQSLVMDRIRELGTYDSCPDAMAVDRETGLAWRQFDVDYEVDSTNGRTRKAERLRLNLYLDVGRRAQALVRLRLALEEQRDGLEEALRRGEAPSAQAAEPADGGTPGLAGTDSGSPPPVSGDGRPGAGAPETRRGYYRVTCDRATGRMVSYAPDEAAIARARLTAGYFASVTHRIDLSPMEAYHHYRLRDEQEKYFEQMKDQMAADRQRCWSEEGWEGRQLILFVGLVLGSHVRHVWRTRLRDRFSSSLEILDEMRSIRCIEHPGHARRITPFVGAQLEICRAFGLEPPKGCGPGYVSIRTQKRKRGRPPKKQVVQDND